MNPINNVLSKKPVLYALGALCLLLVIIWIVRKLRLRSSRKPDFNKSDFTVSEQKLKALALEIYNVLDGVTDGTEQKLKALGKLLPLNDSEFSYTIWIFNRDHAGKCWGCGSEETLRSWINDEWIVYDPQSRHKKVINRMDALGIA